MSIADLRFCAFDLETTGVDPEECRIVTAAVAHVGGGLRPVTHSWLADPGVPIPAEAVEVHGIDSLRAQADGKPAAQVVQQVRDELAGAEGPLVIFNARYDLTVLDRECRRHGIEPLDLTENPADGSFPIRVIDPLVIDKWLDRYRSGKRQLAVMAEHYRAKLTDAHDADADALAAARIAWRILHADVVRRVRSEKEQRELAALCDEWDVARSSIDDLHTAQVGWAWEQAVGLEQYFSEKEGKPVTIEKAWPVIPFDPTLAPAAAPEPNTTTETT